MMNIFSHKGRITPADDKTNITHTFTVPDGVERLVVRYSYSPKEVEDEDSAMRLVAEGLRRCNTAVVNVSSFLPVKNLITLSFDENGSYRGACHRQPNEQTIIIAETGSTSGINNSPIQAGEWAVVLNVHFAGCDIDYTVDIEGEIK